MADHDEEFSEEEFEEEVKPLTFDNMVSFTMFIEISLILISSILFVFYLYLSS